MPAFNEAAVIADVVRRSAQALLDLAVPDPQVIVVDDGSTDATATLASGAGVPGVTLTVLFHRANRGYGAALRTGFRAATGDAIWLLDGDGQFDPADLAALLRSYADDSVVAGFRIRRSDPAIRRLNQAAFFTVVRLLFGPTARDVNCGFKLFPRAVAAGLGMDGALISTQLVLRARRAGYRIVDVGVPHYPRRGGHATGASPRVVARAFAELGRMVVDRALLNGLAPPS